MKFTNALIKETSPYLLQHAHNPVQWYPWGEEALARARESDKPILVSIGYAACHWCHVMEKESFENEEVAAFMNQHFINIKIDREERPDLDHIYMDAVQAIAGNGGWPLNVFLTTDARPFYGGTYFPPRKAFNRSSWTDVLNYMVDAWHNKRDEVEEQARTLLDHVKSSSKLLVKKIALTEEETSKFLSVDTCHEITKNVLKSADRIHGGFGQAPKFPQTMTIQFLLAYGFRFKDSDALKHAEFSLQKLINGGIYDQLAGGMARYSTDREWLAPHFEKMLYDNALLVNVLCDAYQITKSDFYEQAIHKTLGFLIDEMKHPDGGFYAAVDADSEGEEGKFYVWDLNEIEKLLGDKASLFCEFYDVSEEGNWEHKNILQVKESIEVFASSKNMEVLELEQMLEEGRGILLAARANRIAPAIDDKILLGWNALLLTAFCKASACLGSEKYRGEAVTLAEFIFDKFTKDGEVIFHSYKNNEARHPAFLDDLAYLTQGCIWLQQITGDNDYLAKARTITESVFEDFFDPESGLFFFSGKGQKDVVARKLEVYDGATPAGNSIMAENLFYLSTVFEHSEWRNVALEMLMSVKDVIIPYPTSFGVWANLILQQISGVKEVAVTGSNAADVGKEILKLYLPGRVLQVGEVESEWPLLKNKLYEEKARIYVCKNYVCAAPVLSLGEFSELVYD